MSRQLEIDGIRSYDRVTNGLPRHRDRRRSEPALWGASPAPMFGSYGKGFLQWASRLLQVPRQQILHICAGTLPVGEGLARVDIRREVSPDVVGDGCALPIRDGVAPAVMIDPPYTPEYARDLYQTSYPRPAHLLAEASRVARPGAPVAMLHFVVPSPVAGLKIEAVHGVWFGCGYRIRALTVFRAPQASLF